MMKYVKFLVLVFFLLIPGLQENNVPFVALLIIFLFQSIGDIINNSVSIFWEGLFVIPVIINFILFIKSKSIKFSIIYFVVLIISIIYFSGLLQNFERISFWYIITFSLFIIFSIKLLLDLKKK